MAASEKLSIVLVHGTWADGSNWDGVVPFLFAKGHDVVAVQNPLTSLADDVTATHRAIDRMPSKVLLVGHSWGGAVVTEAGRHENVAGIVYVAAFVPDEGESVNNILSGGHGAPPPSELEGIEMDSHGFFWMTHKKLSEDFAQDLPAHKISLMACRQGPAAAECFAAKLGAPAWRAKPSWYVVAEEDRMIPETAARGMAKRAGATTSSLHASHCVLMSRPAEVAAVILDAARVLQQ